MLLTSASRLKRDLWGKCKRYEILWFTLNLTHNLCFEVEGNIFQNSVTFSPYGFLFSLANHFVIVCCHTIVNFTTRFGFVYSEHTKECFRFARKNSREIIFFSSTIVNYYFILRVFLKKMCSRNENTFGERKVNVIIVIMISWEKQQLKNRKTTSIQKLLFVNFSGRFCQVILDSLPNNCF